MGPQRGRLAAEQIDTPEAVFHVAQERQPRGPSGGLIWSVVMGENPSNHVLVDGDVERQGDRGWQRSLRFLRFSRQCGFVPERERITFCEAQQDLPAGILIEQSVYEEVGPIDDVDH
ncbi:MAG TPA: hypothetical protein VKG65_01025 [Terriglobales bacterium]|nr:hypothetical protein [Terriglobales bacterium]